MLVVNTLGRFQMRNTDGVINDDNIRSTMLTKLLIYLIVHREQAVTVDELSCALWQEEETDNPAGALKNLMYRLRNLLRSHFGDAEFILTNRGSYCWNSQTELVVDVEEFERLYEKCKRPELTDAERVSYYEKAISLYQGDFMSKIVEMHWCVTLTTYYHSMFLSCVKELAELYIKNSRYDDLEKICNQAIQYDNVDEQLHYYLILARMKNNKIKLALESYEKACKILDEELGIHNPTKLQEIYEELLNMKKGIQAENIVQVREDMSENAPEGVFMCGYPVFKEIYRLEARKKNRLGEAEYVLLLTVNTPESLKDQIGKVEIYRINSAMSHLEEALKNSLRLGDVAAKYSDSQYVILLPSCSYEGSVLVANRIIEKFYEDSNAEQNIRIKINLEEVTAADDIMNK